MGNLENTGLGVGGIDHFGDRKTRLVGHEGMRGILRMLLPEQPVRKEPGEPWPEIEDLSMKKEGGGLKNAKYLQLGRVCAGTPVKSTIFSDGQSF